MEGSPESDNLFELISDGKFLVPRIITLPGREEDLALYKEGWVDQSKSLKTEIRPGISDNWYDAGASRCWSSLNFPTDGQKLGDHEDGVDMIMHRMRANPKMIPRGAWSDEDFGSDRKVDGHPDRKSKY